MPSERLSQIMSDGRYIRSEKRRQERSRLQREQIPLYRGQEDATPLLEYPNGSIVPKGQQITNGAIVSGDTPLVLDANGQTFVYGMPHYRTEETRSESFSLRWEYEAYDATWSELAPGYRIDFANGDQCGGVGRLGSGGIMLGYLNSTQRTTITFTGTGVTPLYDGQWQRFCISTYDNSNINRIRDLEAFYTYFNIVDNVNNPLVSKSLEAAIAFVQPGGYSQIFNINSDNYPDRVPDPTCGTTLNTLEGSISQPENPFAANNTLTFTFAPGQHLIVIAVANSVPALYFADLPQFRLGCYWSFSYSVRRG